jgi:hypothetical protein
MVPDSVYSPRLDSFIPQTINSVHSGIGLATHLNNLRQPSVINQEDSRYGSNTGGISLCDEVEKVRTKIKETAN